MALILCWSVARLVTGGPDHDSPTSAVLNGSGGPEPAATPGRRRRSRSSSPRPAAARGSWSATAPGKVVFSGELAYGQRPPPRRSSPPVRIQSTDGSVEVTVDGQDRGRMGPAGRPATAVLRRTPVRSPARPRQSGPVGRGGILERLMTTTTPLTCSVALVTLGLRPQRGRLRGARRPARGRRLPAGRRPGGRRHGRGQHLRLRRGGQEGLRRHAARGRRPQGRPARTAGGRRGRLPGRAVRQGPRRVAARGRRGARLRRLPRHRRPAALDPGRGDATTRTRRRTAAGCCRSRRPSATRAASVPGHAGSTPTDVPVPARPATGPRAVRRRLDGGPMAPLKLASGCDRRCSFCAIPSFRGSFVSRRPSDVLGEARWLAGAGRPRAVPGQRELHVLRQGPRRPPAARDAAARAGRRRRRRAGPGVLPAARRDPARAWSRRSRRRPAWRRTSTCPSSTPAPRCCAGCAASATPRASSACSTRSAALAPEAGVRSNVIVGFPGETEDDLETLCDFLVAARLDVTGVFGYSDEDGTEAAALRRQARRGRDPGPGRARHRPGRGADRRSGPRSGSASGSWCWSSRVDDDGEVAEGRADHQGPEVDGTTTLAAPAGHARRRPGRRRASSRTEGVDLVAGADRDDRAMSADEPQVEQLEPAQRADRRCGS